MFDLSAVGAQDRLGALNALLAAWEPVPDAQFLVSWEGDSVQAFAIERRRLAQAQLKADQWLPETLAREPAVDGVRLVQGLDGIEAQAWKSGVLQATRWWAEVPDTSELRLFLRHVRSADSPPLLMPAIQSPKWTRPGRMPVRSEQLGSVNHGNEPILVGALILVLLVASAMSARVLWDAHLERNRVAIAVTELQQEVAPVIAAREKALAAADRSANLIAQLLAPQPLEVLEGLVTLLPKAALIREFDLNGLDVRVLLDLPADVPRSKVIADLESNPWFSQLGEVRDGQSRSGLDLQMKLSGPWPPQRSGPDAGLQRLASDDAQPARMPEAKTGVKP